jgi:hypothetical protein
LLKHDLFRPAFTRRSTKRNDEPYQGFAQAGNCCPPRLASGAGFFAIMRYTVRE